MLKALVDGIRTRMRVSAQDAELAEYGEYISAIAEVGSCGTVREIGTEERASVVIAELITRAQGRVIIFGHQLSDSIFMSGRVLRALQAFSALDPDGRIVFITNDTRFRTRFMELQLFESERTEWFPITREVAGRYFFKNVVLSNGITSQSYWFVSGSSNNPCGTFEFSSPEAGKALRTSLESILSQFGLPAHTA